MPDRPIDPVSLRIFLAALDTGSLGRAAQRASIVPSAVSRRISELESFFGVPLLERGLKGVQPTPAGLVLAAHARTILQDMGRLRREMAGFTTGVRGQVRLSASVAALTGSLPADIQSFRAGHPQVHLSLREETTVVAFRQVADGESDLAVGSDLGVPDGLRAHPYGHCELAAVVPSGHLLAGRPMLSFEALAPFEQIELLRDNGISRLLAEAARTAGVERRVSARVGSHETVCTLVGRGMGVGVVPMYLRALRPADAGLQFLPLADARARLRLLIVARADDALPPAAAAFLDHLTAQASGN